MAKRLQNTNFGLCEDSEDWVAGQPGEMKVLVGSSFEPSGRQAMERSEVRALYQAVRLDDLTLAVEICERAQDWRPVVMDVIDRIEAEWREDVLPVGQTAEAFWNTRCLIETLCEGRPVVRSPQLYVGHVALLVPQDEQHTFGTQLLADRLRRSDWYVEALTNVSWSETYRILARTHFDVLGISVGCDGALSGLADRIAKARAKSLNPDIEVIVGGSAIEGPVGRHGFLGTDFAARSADDVSAYFGSIWSGSRRKAGKYHG